MKKNKCSDSTYFIFLIPLFFTFMDIIGIDTYTKNGHLHQPSMQSVITSTLLSIGLYLYVKFKCTPWIIYKCTKCGEVFNEEKLIDSSKECIYCQCNNIVDIKEYYKK